MRDKSQSITVCQLKTAVLYWKTIAFQIVALDM